AGQPAANQPAGALFITADPGLAAGVYPVVIEGMATINGKPVVVRANTRVPLGQALANLPFPPRGLLSQAVGAVTEKPPFTLALKLDAVERLRGSPAEIIVTATRSPGCTEEIALTAVGLPANVASTLKTIPKDQSEVKAQLTPAANAALGKFLVSVTGKTKHQNNDYTVLAPPAELVLVPPFELKVEPAPLKLAPGDRAQLKVTATRMAGYQGPIALEVRNLPAKVTATKTTIEMGKSEVEIEVMAAADAAVGDKADVNVLGTAAAAGNQQHPSPNFTLSVMKK